jgi:MtrB/PioB family decaheme-associated outer membrane protein
LPYTVNPALVITTPLPRDSLNGEINTAYVNLRVTSHPWDDVHLRAGYVFDDRDNQTPIALYNYVRTDAENQNTASLGRMRYNLPYSFTTNKVDVEGDYDFTPTTTGTLGYAFENINRTYQEVKDTRENTISARFKTMPVDFATVTLNGSAGRRRGTNYDCTTFGDVGFPPPGEGCIIDPELRKDYEANRNRFRWGNTLNLMPAADYSVGIKTDFVRDHYTDSLLGLQNRDTDSFSVDASTTAIPDVSLYGYYTLFLVTQRQLGTNSGGDPTAHYQVREYDTVNTIGTGFDWTAIPDRLNINFDYLFQFATTEYDFRNGPSITTQPLPDLKTRYQSASILGTYHIQKDVALKLGYQFEWFQTFDWAYTNVALSQVNNVLGMGGVGIGTSEDYVAHIGMVSAVVDF